MKKKIDLRNGIVGELSHFSLESGVYTLLGKCADASVDLISEVGVLHVHKNCKGRHSFVAMAAYDISELSECAIKPLMLDILVERILCDFNVNPESDTYIVWISTGDHQYSRSVSENKFPE